ncbi:MAG TPA: DUF2975 domain-containing protein [Opitutaceae bacterium]
MNPQTESKLRRIERLSTLFRGCCTAIIVVFSVATAVAAVAAFLGRLTSITFANQSFVVPAMPVGTRLLLSACVLLTGAAAIKALYHLRRLMDNYARRGIFTASSAKQMRDFGISCLLWGGVKVLWSILSAVFASHQSTALTVTGDAFVIGAVVIVIARFMEMAVDLREENDLTI